MEAKRKKQMSVLFVSLGPAEVVLTSTLVMGTTHSPPFSKVIWVVFPVTIAQEKFQFMISGVTVT